METRYENRIGEKTSALPGRKKRPGDKMRAMLAETAVRECDLQLEALEELRQLRDSGRMNSRRACELRLQIAASEARLDSAEATELRVFGRLSRETRQA